MRTKVYRYKFKPAVALEEIEAALVLAIKATENLHGESAVRLDVGHYLDVKSRTCVIDASTQVGRDLNRLFVGFLRREYGDDAFQVKRADAVPQRQPQRAQA